MLENEKKPGDIVEPENEFEIPDVSTIEAEFGTRKEEPTPEPPKKKKKRRKHKSNNGSESRNKDNEPVSDTAAPSAEVASPEDDVDAKADVNSNLEAGADADVKSEAVTSTDVIAEADTDAVSVAEATAEADPVSDAEITAVADPASDAEVTAEADPVSDAEVTAEADPTSDADDEFILPDGAFFTDVQTEDDEPDVGKSGGREYAFPDDALAPEPEPEELPFPDDALAPDVSEIVITDLLGDPIEEPCVPTEAEEEVLDDPSENTVDEGEESEADINEEEPEAVEEAPREAEPKTAEEPATEKNLNEYDPEKPRRIDGVFDFIELLIFTLVAVLVLTTFFVKHAIVEGNSMYDTLEDGDILLISDLFYTPKCGDIVVIEDYTTVLKKPIVKRVIATGGQIVKVTKNGVYINKSEIMLDEKYVYTDYEDYEYLIAVPEEIASLPGFLITSEFYEFRVPDGELFVMGDHRNDSTDSRAIGCVLEDAVLGRVLFRLYPNFGDPDKDNR